MLRAPLPARRSAPAKHSDRGGVGAPSSSHAHEPAAAAEHGVPRGSSKYRGVTPAKVRQVEAHMGQFLGKKYVLPSSHSPPPSNRSLAFSGDKISLLHGME